MSIGGLLRNTGAGKSKSRPLRGNTRAQSVVIGSILIFGLLVLTYGIFQATIIPSANEDIEIQHSQQVREQMSDLRNDIKKAGSSGRESSTSIKVGVTYPPRAIFLNPGPPSGSLRTEGTEDSDVGITVTNAKALNEETADYWGSGSSNEFGTGAITYRPNYNIYQNGPDAVRVENSLVYSSFDDNSLLAADQDIVSGRDISLTALDGKVSASQVPSYTIDTKAVSPATTTVPVKNDGGDIKIEIATKLSEETLVQDVFYSEFDDEPAAGDLCGDFSDGSDNADDRYVKDCDFNPGGAPGDFNSFTLILESGTTYNLEMAKVGVGSGTQKPSAHYITTTSESGGSLVDVEKREFTFQVRDRFNNPVSGVKVPLKATEGKFENGNPSDPTEITLTTDEDGRVTVTYIPDDLPDGSSTTGAVTAGGSLDLNGDGNLDFDPNDDSTSQAREEADFEFTITDSEADTNVGASINPSGPIVLKNSRTSGEQGGGPNSIKCNDGPSNSGECFASITLKNNGGEEYKIKELRYHFYIAPQAPGINTREAPPESVKIDDKACNTGNYPFQGDFKDADQFGSISAGNTKTFVMNFARASGNFETIQGDGFIVTIKFESTSPPTNTFSLTFFASPTLDTSLDNSCP